MWQFIASPEPVTGLPRVSLKGSYSAAARWAEKRSDSKSQSFFDRWHQSSERARHTGQANARSVQAIALTKALRPSARDLRQPSAVHMGTMDHHVPVATADQSYSPLLSSYVSLMSARGSDEVLTCRPSEPEV